MYYSPKQNSSAQCKIKIITNNLKISLKTDLPVNFFFNITKTILLVHLNDFFHNISVCV